MIKMAKKKSKKGTEEPFEAVHGALSRTEQFIENNQKLIIYIVLGIVLVVLAIIGFRKFILEPKQKEAASQIFVAEYYFERDSFQLALEGDGSNLGFLDIIDEYGRTSVGNLAYYYAGACYMRLQDFETAIEYLDKYKAKDDMLGPISIGLKGDAYAELGETDKAIKLYLEAAKKADNEFVSPLYLMRAGLAYENNGEYQKALEIYERIEKEYYGTNEQRNIEKYITRVKIMLEQ